MAPTDPIAVYAATVATIVLVWDFVKWMLSGVRLRISASQGMHYVNPDGQLDDQEGPFTLVLVANRGDLPTSITHFIMLAYLTPFHRLVNRLPIQFLRDLSKPTMAGFIPQQGGGMTQLPYLLKPGEYWQGMVMQRNVDELLSQGAAVYIGVHRAEAKYPDLIRVKRVDGIDGDIKELE